MNTSAHLAWRGGRARRSAAGSRWVWSGMRWRRNTGSAFRPAAITFPPISVMPWPSPKRAREAIFQAFQHRHCYGATDNIVMDVRSGEHLMGDEFTATDGKPVALKVFVHGTRPIARVDVIKDFRYVFSTEPNKQRALISNGRTMKPEDRG